MSAILSTAARVHWRHNLTGRRHRAPANDNGPRSGGWAETMWDA